MGGAGRQASLSSRSLSAASLHAMKAVQQSSGLMFKHGPVETVRSWLKQEKWGWLQKLAFEIAFEVILVVVFLKAYNMVRNKFGSQKCTPQFALGHALQVINTEKALGIFWEQEIQGMVLGWTWWIKFWNIFYGSAHMAVTVFVLGFLFALRPAAYQSCRTVFILMNLLAIIGYAAYPLMPPRLVNVCDDPYGGCVREYSFVDTLHEVGGLWSWKHKSISKVSNHYAAMPSMHMGYSLWCSLSMYGHSPYTLFRVLALMYPILTLYCIVVTANHFFMDAVFGALALWVATKLGACMPAIGRGADCLDVRLEGSGSGSSGQSGGQEGKGALLPLFEPHHHDSSSTNGKQQNGSSTNGKQQTGDADAAGVVQAVHITLSSLQKR